MYNQSEYSLQTVIGLIAADCIKVLYAGRLATFYSVVLHLLGRDECS